jgi:hypothetical protein
VVIKVQSTLFTSDETPSQDRFCRDDFTSTHKQARAKRKNNTVSTSRITSHSLFSLFLDISKKNTPQTSDQSINQEKVNMIFTTTSPVSIFAILVAAASFAAPSSCAATGVNTCELGQVCRQPILHVPENETSPIFVLPDIIVHANVDDDDDDSSSRSTTRLLKQHIQSIQDYVLATPTQHHANFAQQTTDLEERLEDLEEQLSQSSEKVQEFYSLGGWPLLASLVSPSTHDSNNINKNVNVVNKDWNDKILAIRAHAAWAMGTAVKQMPEFGPWVLQEIQVNDGADATATNTATPLSLVVQALLEVSHVAATPGVHSDSAFEYQELLAQKALYALESFLHGNPPAQVAFATMSSSPAKVLGRQAAVWVKEAATTAATVSSNAPMSRHAIAMTTRLLGLANDILVKIDDGSNNNINNNKAVFDVFSTDDWHQAAAMGAALSPSSSFKKLVFSSLQRKALLAMTTFGLAAKATSVPTQNLHEEL